MSYEVTMRNKVIIIRKNVVIMRYKNQLLESHSWGI